MIASCFSNHYKSTVFYIESMQIIHASFVTRSTLVLGTHTVSLPYTYSFSTPHYSHSDKYQQTTLILNDVSSFVSFGSPCFVGHLMNQEEHKARFV